MTNTSSTHFQLFRGVPWMIVYICETVLILTGNSITVYIFWSIRKRLKRTSYLLINLAVADILVGIGIIFWLWDAIAVMMEMELSSIVGKTALIVDVIGIISSILSLALISLERMLAILWPFRHRTLSTRYYHVSVAIVWFLAFLNVTVNVNIDNAYSILTVGTVISSVLIITGAYLAIWISTRRNEMSTNVSRTAEQHRKLAKTLFIVTALSIVTYLPSGISIAFRDYLTHLHSFRVQITIVVQYSNSFLNPVVYCFKMPEFKTSLKKLLSRCWRRHSSFGEQLSGSTSGVILKWIKSVETL
ncbi:somatostatin receptor type 2-like [Oculina patagonica]